MKVKLIHQYGASPSARLHRTPEHDIVALIPLLIFLDLEAWDQSVWCSFVGSEPSNVLKGFW